MKVYPERAVAPYDEDYFTDGVIYDTFAHKPENSVWREQYEMITDTVGTFAGEETLDLGGARGCLANEFAKEGCIAYMQEGSKWACDNAFISQESVKHGNLSDGILYGSNVFEIVTCIEVFEHILDVEYLFSETSRVLKNDGFLYCSIGLGDDEHGHVRIGTDEEWKDLLNRTPHLTVDDDLTKAVREHPIRQKWGWCSYVCIKNNRA